MKRIYVRTAHMLGLAVLLGVFGGACSGDSGNAHFDQCLPDVPADECYASRRDPESDQVALASEIALRYIDEHAATSHPWDWGPSALMFALTELYRVTGDDRFRTYYSAWLNHHVAEGFDIVWSDDCPGALTAISLLTETPSDEHQKVVDDTLHYLEEVAPRTADGGISHNGLLGNTPSIWVDSLFMFGMVLTRWGELDGDPARLDMLSEQLGIFQYRLQHDNGLMQHAHDWKPPPDTDIYWNRGNSWVVASVSDYLRVRLLRGEADPEVEAMFRKHVGAVVELQEATTGLWWSIMNRPGEIYLETSGSAMFAYGMARAFRYGILGERELAAARRAVEGVKERIEFDELGRPFVTGISGPTDPWTFEEYAAVPLYDDLHFGVGAAILALIETSGLPE